MTRRLFAILVLVAPTGLTAQLAVSARPTLTIAATDASGNPLIEQIGGATRLPDGTLLVLDASKGVVSRFATTGKLLKTAGGMGDGPGEFRAPVWAGRCGATTYVWDRRLNRLTPIDPQGMLGQGLRLPTAGSGVPTPFEVRCMPGGGFAYLSAPRPAEGPCTGDVVRGVADLVVISATGASVRQLTALPVGELLVLGGGAGPRPLAPWLTLTPAGKGVRFGSGATASFSEFAGTTPVRTIPVALASRKPTAAEMTAAIDYLMELFPSQVRTRVRPAYDAATPPTSTPHYLRMLADSEGMTWLETSMPGGARTQWTVVDASGKTIGVVALDGRVELYEVARDYLVARRVSDDGEEQVVIHSVKR